MQPNTYTMSEMNSNFIYFFNKTNLNTEIIKYNINYIKNNLNNLNPLSDKLQYLSLSCIYGAFFGDAIGGNCEFLTPSKNNYLNIFKYYQGFRFLPGEITDDSELAMSAAFAYMDVKDQNDPRIQDYIFYYFGIWKESHPKDMGYTTINSLKYFNSSHNIDQIKFDKIKSIIQKENWNSLSNGSLMRLSTFIVFYLYSNYEKINSTITNYFNNNISNEMDDDLINLLFDIFNKVKLNVEITHPYPEMSIAAAIFSLMVLTGMIRNNAKDIYSLFKIISFSKKFIQTNKDKNFKYFAQEIQKKFHKIIFEIEKNEPISVYNSMGYYMNAFKLSIYYLYKFPQKGQNNDKDLYYRIMCNICNLGGDTDTNCAIVGTMIGPLLGYKNFNSQLFNIFITYFPERRTQYTSAFMYIYVKYLEEKYFKNNAAYNDKKDNYPSYTKLIEFLKKKII